MLGELGGLLILIILIGILVLALSIFLACKLFNAMSGGPGSVSAQPEAGFGKSLGIAVIMFVIQIVLGFLLAMVLAEHAMRGGGGGFASLQGFGVIQIVMYVLMVLILAALLCPFLPTTFGRALLTSLIAVVLYVVLSFIVNLLIITVLAGGRGL